LVGSLKVIGYLFLLVCVSEVRSRLLILIQSNLSMSLSLNSIFLSFHFNVKLCFLFQKEIIPQQPIGRSS